jgi:hypothetical protein
VRASAETLTAFRALHICRDGSEMEPAVANITYRVFMCSHFVWAIAGRSREPENIASLFVRLQRIKHRLMRRC